MPTLSFLSQASASPSSSKGLNGVTEVAGDKSISHRAVILSAISTGNSHIEGLLEGEDVLATIAAFRKLGVQIEQMHQDGAWAIQGIGLSAFRQPDTLLDMGNSGTAMRLMMGVLAGQKMRCVLSGDSSLNQRPMRRVVKPLTQMGAHFICRDDDYPPLTVQGSDDLMAIDYEMELASAQIKSAILLAALNAAGISKITEPKLCRDHTERMLEARGAEISLSANPHGEGRLIALKGHGALDAMDITIPGDPSSAAFLLVAALVTPHSKITIKNIGLNPTRTGLFIALKQMGANLKITNERVLGGEPIGDIVAASSNLKGITLSPDIAPSMIDEYPILSIAAAYASGSSKFTGLAELRVKECDRLAAVENGLKINKIECFSGEDWIEIKGQNGSVKGGGLVETHLDHRIAMSFLILGLASQEAVYIDDSTPIATSFPNFLDLMTKLGADYS